MCLAFQYQNHYTNLEDIQTRTAKLQVASIALMLNYNKIINLWKLDHSLYAKKLQETMREISKAAESTKVVTLFFCCVEQKKSLNRCEVLTKVYHFLQVNVNVSNQASGNLKESMDNFLKITEMLEKRQLSAQIILKEIKTRSEELEHRFATNIGTIDESMSKLGSNILQFYEASEDILERSKTNKKIMLEGEVS